MRAEKKKPELIYLSNRTIFALANMSCAWTVTLFSWLMSGLKGNPTRFFAATSVILSIIAFFIGRKERRKILQAIEKGTIALTPAQVWIFSIYTVLFIVIFTGIPTFFLE